MCRRSGACTSLKVSSTCAGGGVRLRRRYTLPWGVPQWDDLPCRPKLAVYHHEHQFVLSPQDSVRRDVPRTVMNDFLMSAALGVRFRYSSVNSEVLAIWTPIEHRAYRTRTPTTDTNNFLHILPPCHRFPSIEPLAAFLPHPSKPATLDRVTIQCFFD